MKKQLLTVTASILFWSVSVLAQIPNGDFENWTIGTNGFLDPNGYQCSNNDYSGASIYQDAGYTGSFSVKFSSVYDSSSGSYQPGMLRLVHQPFPASSNPSTLSGYWKTYNPNITDALGLELHLFDASNMEVGTGDINTPFTGSIPNWTPFSIPIHYTSANPVANFSLDIIWILLSNDPATFANLDALSFDVGTGILPVTQKNDLFQIRAIDGMGGKFSIDIDPSIQGEISIQVFSLAGHKVHQQTSNDLNAQSVEMNLNELPAGMYICSISNKKALKSFKLIKMN